MLTDHLVAQFCLRRAGFDFYNSTLGASSFDGTHYSYQVAMERAQVFLNYLDAAWGEVVELGGLVEH